jgi:hypothetical protein
MPPSVPPLRRADPDHGLRAKCHKNIPRVDWQAIELGVLGAGVPDSNFCGDGVEGWVEHKWTETYAVPLRPEQVGWISRRMRNGGRVFVLTWRETTGGPRSGPPASELWMHEGHDVVQLKAEGLLSCPPVFCMEGGPSRWDWGLVRSALLEWQIGRR